MESRYSTDIGSLQKVSLNLENLKNKYANERKGKSEIIVSNSKRK